MCLFVLAQDVNTVMAKNIGTLGKYVAVKMYLHC